MGFHSEFRSVIGPKEDHMTFFENKPPQTTIKITMNYQTNDYKPQQTTTNHHKIHHKPPQTTTKVSI